jgi:hypothetical protein
MAPQRRSESRHLPDKLLGSEQFVVKQLRPLAITLMLLMFALSAVGLFLSLPLAFSGYVDYRSFYTAGYMMRTGHGAEIHDYAQTKRFQDILVGPAEAALPYNHLAYESLLHVPFSLLNYRNAYLVFLTCNLMFLAICIRMLSPSLAPFRCIWTLAPLALFLCFLPVSMVLIEGQDSLLLLALFIAANLALNEKKDLRAGMLVGLTLFKFQYALPIALLFLVWRRWRFLAGFAITGILVIALSAMVLGYSGVLSYAHYLPGASANFSTANDAKLGIHPEGMPNLRGLVYMISGKSTSITNVVTVVLSCGVLVWAALRPPSFSGALTAAMLVSFHQMISDTSLLLLPLGLAMARLPDVAEPWRKRLGWLLILAFVGPSILLFLGTRFYLEGLPILALFFVLSHVETSLKPRSEGSGRLQTVTPGQ